MVRNSPEERSSRLHSGRSLKSLISTVQGNKPMILSEWRGFPSAPCFAEKRNLMTARVSMFLKSRESLTFFRTCFLLGRAKDLSAPQYETRFSDMNMDSVQGYLLVEHFILLNTFHSYYA